MERVTNAPGARNMRFAIIDEHDLMFRPAVEPSQFSDELPFTVVNRFELRRILAVHAVRREEGADVDLREQRNYRSPEAD